MNRTVIITYLVLLTACGYDNFDGMAREDIPSQAVMRNCDILFLKKNYFGVSTVIPDNAIIEGYVTANDRTGNWYRSFIIDDGTAAIEVRAGVSAAHLYFTEGRRIVVKAKGLAMGSYEGVLQLGYRINHYSDWRVEDFGSSPVLDKYVFRDIRRKDIAPMALDIDKLDEKHTGRLVRIGPVSIDPESVGGTWAVGGEAGQKPATGVVRFYDGHAGFIDVVTSGYADFARAPVPPGEVWLTGILLYGKLNGGSERFGLRIRSLDDVEIY